MIVSFPKPKVVKPERNGWRNEDISRRHRQWGFDVPAVDIDFLLLEYNHAKPVALIEYKHKNCAKWDPGHPTYLALRALADGYRNGPLPCLVVTYCPGEWWFRVTPLNDAARKFYRDGQIMTEQEYMRSLYRMRGLDPDATNY